MGKYSFGPGSRAYVQGGVGFYVAGSPSSNYTDEGSTTNQEGVSLSSFDLSLGGPLSTDVKVAAGYAFGRWGVRANFLDKNLYFNIGSTTIPSYIPATFFDVHEQTYSGGVTYTLF